MDGVPIYFSGIEDIQSGGTRRHSNNRGRKKLRILVVNDFDLKSSAKLAESSLLSSNNIQNHMSRHGDPLLEKCVDLCIAVNTASEFSAPDGLYDPDDELLQYYKGQTRRARMLKTTTTKTSATVRSQIRLHTPYSYTYNGTETRHLRGRPRIGKKTLSSSFRSVPVPVPLPPASQPIFYDSCENDNVDCRGGIGEGDNDERLQYDPGQLIAGISPEERAARRGLITAALSQLESIVCRVAYVLKDDRGNDDRSPHVHLRLTSNSLDVRNRWLPLVEGLGLAGLVEEPEQTSMEHQSSSATDTHSEDSECDSNVDSPSIFPSAHRETSESSLNVAVVSPSVSKDKCEENDNHSRILEGLLRSAHPLRLSNRERDEDPFTKDREGLLFQSIVITAAPASIKAPAKSEIDLDATVELKSESSSCSMERQWSATKYGEAKNEFVSDHLLLEIAAGSQATPSSHSFSSHENASTTVVFPGSLRTRGEFCLVDLVLDDGIETEGIGEGSTSVDTHYGKQRRSFRWRVEETHFHRLESEQETRELA